MKQTPFDNAPQGGETEEQRIAQKIVGTFACLDIGVRLEDIIVGATVTRYLFSVLSRKTRMSNIKACADDIKAAIQTNHEIMIEAPFRDTNMFAIEVANKSKSIVNLFELMDTPEFRNASGELNFIIGEDVSGKVIIGDLAKMPHLLIAGTTGSGKTVCLNNLIVSLLCQYSYEHVQFVFVDPKYFELSRYNGIPHLLNKSQAIVSIDDALASMDALIAEMEARFKLFSANSVCDIKEFNKKRTDEKLKGMPYIVFILDELSYLMAEEKKKFEVKLLTLTQKSRAAGIHIVLATQRPSTDIITGTIKANIQCRMALKVCSSMDSYTILNSGGAEKLIGMGDMLFMDSNSSYLTRVQSAYLSNDEIGSVIGCALSVDGPHNYYVTPRVFYETYNRHASNASKVNDEIDELRPYYKKALRFWLEKNNGKASISSIQRALNVGFNRAGRILENLQKMGYVESSPFEDMFSNKPLKVVVTLQDLDALFPDED